MPVCDRGCEVASAADYDVITGAQLVEPLHYKPEGRVIGIFH
jgi:hypothetical protein